MTHQVQNKLHKFIEDFGQKFQFCVFQKCIFRNTAFNPIDQKVDKPDTLNLKTLSLPIIQNG